MKLPSGPVAERIGFLLCRVIVPLWVLAGALMKLEAKSPKLLPKNLWTTADDVGLNLYVVLFVLVGLEFFAVAVTWCLPRFARFMAIWMLSIFCLILIGEIVAGNTACGCLGSASPSPWVMLAIDGALLLGVLLFRPRTDPAAPWVPKRGLAIAALITVVGFAVTGWRVLGEIGSGGAVAETPSGGGEAAAGSEDGAATGGESASAAAPAPARPDYFRLRNPQAMAGTRFADTQLAQLVEGWPEDLGIGPRYVIFYSKSCDHCRDLLETHLQGPLPVPTTLVAIPEAKEGFNESSWLDMQFCRDCVSEELELVTGVDYLITPPVVVALMEGEITCIKEADDALEPACFTW